MHMYNDFVKNFLSSYVKNMRKAKGLSKTEMSAHLRIDPRSYADLESGKYCFSAASLLFLLSTIEDEEIIQMIRSFQTEAASLDEQELVKV